ncbi:MAG: hypothetical protein VKI83_02090 [Synechococcaceae cyanobacterium]|nr:hypothetical protein [Synechococcaceae cyanobacterium]
MRPSNPPSLAAFQVLLTLLQPWAALADPKPYTPPSLNPTGVESAFIASQGDYFVYAAGFGYESGPAARWVTDGSAGLGIGLGSASRSLAVQLGYNLTSLRPDRLSGGVDLKVARELLRTPDLRWALAAGVLDLTSHGPAATTLATPYAVTTLALPIRFEGARRTLQFNLGVGGNRFQIPDSLAWQDRGGFASVGLEVADNLGLSLGWTGRGLNTTLNLVPLRGVPLAIGASASNLTNHRGLGRAAVLFLTWGGTFQTASF